MAFLFYIFFREEEYESIYIARGPFYYLGGIPLPLFHSDLMWLTRLNIECTVIEYDCTFIRCNLSDPVAFGQKNARAFTPWQVYGEKIGGG